MCAGTLIAAIRRKRNESEDLAIPDGASDIGVTLNTYTHLRLEDAAEEMKRMEALEKARLEMNGGEKEKPMKQNMFKVI